MWSGVAVGWVLCSLCALSPGRVQPAPANIVANPSFEEAAGGAPTGSTFASRRGEPQSAWEVRDGGHCVRITVDDKEEDGSWNQDNIAASPGARVYRLSAMVKTDLAGCAPSPRRELGQSRSSVAAC